MPLRRFGNFGGAASRTVDSRTRPPAFAPPTQLGPSTGALSSAAGSLVQQLSPKGNDTISPRGNERSRRGRMQSPGRGGRQSRAPAFGQDQRERLEAILAQQQGQAAPGRGFDRANQLSQSRAAHLGATRGGSRRGMPFANRFSFGQRRGRGGRPPAFNMADARRRDMLFRSSQQAQQGMRPPAFFNPGFGGASVPAFNQFQRRF